MVPTRSRDRAERTGRVGPTGTDEVSMAIVGGSSSDALDDPARRPSASVLSAGPPPSAGAGGAETTTGLAGAGAGGTAGHSPDGDIEPLVVGIRRFLPPRASVRDVPR